MLSLKACDIYDVVEPIHAISKLFGISSFSIEKQTGFFIDSITVYNVISIAFATLWNIICTVMCAFGASNLSGLKSGQEFHLSEVYHKSMCCVLFAFLTLSTIGNWWIFATRKHFCQSLNLLLEVDKELKSLGLSVNLTKHKRIVIFMTALTFTLTTFVIIISNHVQNNLHHMSNGIFVVITFTICVERWLLVNTQLIFWMWMVKLRSESLNLFLKNEFLEPGKEFSETGNLKLTQAAELQRKIVEVSECINECYGFPVSLKILS